ncbi:hypothetical protein [Tautonia plasticadhaerens]|uniref:Uncharacterized protein n=1 Tax=Tautonia plasticadhaerens TaxID=2527974 RepID=A0A518HE97_9BACT|nr:hypothetical protein [Tautonia plasticadhaerens]QDV39165.1 hypothetical protein ElP_71290 [Tautonia plasticadhaerens]
MTNRTDRPRISALLLSVAGASLLAAAGCGDDDGVVRGAGSIDVPKPNTFYSPEEAAAHAGGASESSPDAGR